MLRSPRPFPRYAWGPTCSMALETGGFLVSVESKIWFGAAFWTAAVEAAAAS